MKRSEKEEIARKKEEPIRRAVIAELVTKASPAFPLAKSVLENYQLSADITENLLALRKLSLPEIIAAANFLKLLSDDGETGSKKQYKNRETLSHRIIRKIESFFPSFCIECDSTYQPSLDEEPVLTCWACYRPSHDCAAVIEIAEDFGRMKRKSSLKWLCVDCEEKTSLSLRKKLTIFDIGSGKPLSQDTAAEKEEETTSTAPTSTQEDAGAAEGPSTEDLSNVTLYLSQIEDAGDEKTDQDTVKFSAPCKFHQKATVGTGAPEPSSLREKRAPTPIQGRSS